MSLYDFTTAQTKCTTRHTIASHPGRVLSFMLIAIIAFACHDAPPDPVSEEAPETEVLTITPEWIQSNAGSSALAHELNELRKATKKYRDVQKAREDGYDAAISPYIPGMGFHFERIEENEDHPRGTDLTDPPILVYATNGSYNPDPFEPHSPERDDDLILVAVEYAADDPYPNIFSDEDSRRNMEVSEEKGWEFTPPLAGYALHVWVHRGNPDGVFAPFNPTID